jgi:hypothetical protein
MTVQKSTFSVAATGTAPLGYQWRKNGTAISGATSSSYTTPATTASDDRALFSVVVNNSAGNATSSTATLNVGAAAGVVAVQVKATYQYPRKHSTVCGNGYRHLEHGGDVERDWHGLQRRSVWYDFWWGPLHATGEYALARNTSCDRDQRGGPNQISIGECDPRLGNGYFAEHQSIQCICSYCRHELFLGDSDRNRTRRLRGACLAQAAAAPPAGRSQRTRHRLSIRAPVLPRKR